MLADGGRLQSLAWSDFNCDSCGGPFSSQCMVTKQPVPERACAGAFEFTKANLSEYALKIIKPGSEILVNPFAAKIDIRCS